MAGVVNTLGYQDDLKGWLGAATPPALFLRLYSNNYTPVAGDPIGNFTEVALAGYAPIALAGGTWSFAIVAGVVQATYAAQTFAFTAGGNVYGYYVTDDPATKWEWAELFAGGPLVVSSAIGLYVSLEVDGP